MPAFAETDPRLAWHPTCPPSPCGLRRGNSGLDGVGGPDQDRTDDLRNAIAALFQLSYEPMKSRKGVTSKFGLRWQGLSGPGRARREGQRAKREEPRAKGHERRERSAYRFALTPLRIALTAYRLSLGAPAGRHRLTLPSSGTSPATCRTCRRAWGPPSPSA